MAGINIYNAGMVSSLFSSMGTSNTSNNFMSGIDLSTMASIKNGSYKGLLKSYYSDNANESVTQIAGSKDDSKTKTNAMSVRDSAAAVTDAVEELNDRKLWKKTEVKQEDGSTKSEYDRDAIYKSVSAFVKEYNVLVESTGNSDDKAVLRSASNMVNFTKANKDVLNSVGISIDKNNKLSIDEETFKASDMSSVKSIFSGAGSYANSVRSSASMIYGSAVAQVAKMSSTGLYSEGGSYSYISGSTYNRFL